jgi:ferric-dicitrate binding protein FerR (iron transport regulator)
MERTPIQQSEREARAWLLHLTSGKATREDGEAFRRWCTESQMHAEAFARTRRMWEQLGPAIAERRGGAARGDRAAPRHGVRMSRRRFLTTAITASVAAVVVGRYGLDTIISPADASTLRTAVGEQRRVDVAPGVAVEMNTATDIRVSGSGRSITGIRLRSGEAVVHIDPSRQASFTVEVADATLASSPGSAFAVRCNDAAGSVTCLDGHAVLTRAATKTLVKASQQVAFDADGVSAAVAVNPDEALAWRRRVLIYDNQPLADVVADINRYRPGRIVITERALGERRVHARFTLDQMSDVATLIQDAYGAHATHLPGGWVLLS